MRGKAPGNGCRSVAAASLHNARTWSGCLACPLCAGACCFTSTSAGLKHPSLWAAAARLRASPVTGARSCLCRTRLGRPLPANYIHTFWAHCRCRGLLFRPTEGNPALRNWGPGTGDPAHACMLRAPRLWRLPRRHGGREAGRPGLCLMCQHAAPPWRAATRGRRAAGPSLPCFAIHCPQGV